MDPTVKPSARRTAGATAEVAGSSAEPSAPPTAGAAAEVAAEPSARSSARPAARASVAAEVVVEVPDRRLMRRQMLADDVYEAIKTMLMDHAIRPGARISIDGLARDFQVSSTPVREALARLESEGLADKEPLKGYRATPLLSLAEFDDLYRFRLLLEPWAARRAAELIDDTGRDRLTAELATAVEPTAVDYAGYKSLTAHDNRFHTLITGLSGSEQVRLAFQRTHCHLHIFRLHYDRDTGPEVLVEHRQIVESILSGDPAAAESAMTKHLDNSMSVRLRKVYEQ